ncbi:MAG: asparaginase [Hyphomicrobiaceae bacterium]
MTNPVLVDATRGRLVESVHRGAIAVAGPDGGLLLALGDVARPVFPRSSLKLVQALPLVESGAADAFGFTDRELALAGASHSGEAVHVEVASRMLASAGRDWHALECGAHEPIDATAARALHRADASASPLHNNCSGKHAGMIATACFLGEDPKGYVEPAHPVQERIRAIVAELTGEAMTADRCGIDGCSVPNWAASLAALAGVFARLSSGHGVTAARASAARRLFAAAIAEPHMLAGTGRYCTRIMTALSGRVFAKTGAEGFYCAALPDRGIGIALKVDDGAGRAAEIALGAVLGALLPEEETRLVPFVSHAIRNVRGIETGLLRPSPELIGLLARASRT